MFITEAESCKFYTQFDNLCINREAKLYIKEIEKKNPPK